jgi:RNA polymerase sigma factor FliA
MSDPRFASASKLGDAEREALILDHLPLLHHIVGRLVLELPPRTDRDDLLGFGMIGLVEAADSFDPSRGLKFSTYAFPRIRGAILDELRRMDFLPRGRRERVRELDAAVRELEQRHGAPPSPEQIAAHLSVTLDEVDEILASARSAGMVSLEDGPSEELYSLLADPRTDDPVDSAQFEELKVLLVRSIAALPETERTVITLYYAEGLLLKEIGELLGVTESRVSQVHSRALYRLNRDLRTAIGAP